MTNQFKPGDLALIVGSSNNLSPNIGMAVDLVQQLRTNDKFSLPDGRALLNRGPACWLVQAPGLAAALHQAYWADIGGVALVMEQHLIPLRGDCATDLQNVKEAQPA